MLSLEADDLTRATEKYFEYIASAKLDRSSRSRMTNWGHAEVEGLHPGESFEFKGQSFVVEA